MGYFHLYYYDPDDDTVSMEEEFVDTPNICMHCQNTGIQRETCGIKLFGENDVADVIVFTTCIFCNCVTEHYFQSIENDSPFGELKNIKSIPGNVVELKLLSKNISSKFQRFTYIYNQAIKAENMDLDELAGMGYRKALEILVTDFLIQYPIEGVEKEWLTAASTNLSNKISKISNPRLQKVAKAITWLGNDETHYSRLHPEYDIDSMKMFIQLLLSEVENEMIFQEAEKLLKKPKKNR